MNWKLLSENPNDSNAIWGQNDEWIDEDTNPQGICSIAYEGDHYIRSFWCDCCDTWHVEKAEPTYIAHNLLSPMKGLDSRWKEI